MNKNLKKLLFGILLSIVGNILLNLTIAGMISQSKLLYWLFAGILIFGVVLIVLGIYGLIKSLNKKI